MRKNLLLLGFLWTTAVAAFANNKPIEVEKYKLKNGMTVLLHQDNRLPIYSLHLWFKVGSADEDPKRTGLAHFFEHLMFKGTSKNKEGVYDAEIENNGGENNAFTNNDFTGYYVNMPSGTLEKILELEADRMVHLEITEDKVRREREVVKEERRLRTDNSPEGTGYEKLIQSSYGLQSRYRWPVIGSMAHLQKASIADFKTFYKKHYAPNNAVLVIAGSFNKSKAKKSIAKYFGDLQPQNIIKEPRKKGAFKTGQRTKAKKNVSSSLLYLSHPAYSVYDERAKYVDVLAMILAGGKTSRIHKELVEEKKLLASTGSWSFTPKGDGLLMLFNTLRPGVPIYKAEKALRGLLDQVSRKGITEKEFQAALKRIELDHVRSFKTLSGKARTLALNEVLFSDYTRYHKDLEAYKALSFKNTNNFVKSFLKSKKINVVEVSK